MLQQDYKAIGDALPHDGSSHAQLAMKSSSNSSIRLLAVILRRKKGITVAWVLLNPKGPSSICPLLTANWWPVQAHTSNIEYKSIYWGLK